MKHIGTTFLKGLFTLLPLMLSVYLLLWFFDWVESFSRDAILLVAPGFLYWPGMGVVLIFVIIYAAGTIVDRPFVRWTFNMIESLFTEMPVVKTVYMAIRDFTDFLNPGAGRKPNQVVIVKFPGGQVEMVGLMTRENLKDMPEPMTKQDRVAVFFPFSYQLGGATVFIPRAWVHQTTLSVEAAMRSIVTAWLPGQDKKLEGIELS